MPTKLYKRGAWRRFAVPTPAALDVVLCVVAVLLGLHSLALPFGDDQGLYYYVAREWRHGAIPYRDLFDHKTPGIYVVYRMSMVLFGEHLSSIRVLDLACVLVLGVVVARLVTPCGKPLPRGLAGTGCIVASLAHYGFFNYWTTAQTELWFTTLGIASLTAATRIHSLRRAAALAGLLAGVAFLMKPPSVCYAFLATLFLAWRSHEPGDRVASVRRAVKAVGTFALAAGVPLALTLFYFWMHGALAALFDIVVLGNSHYARTFKNATTVPAIAERHLDILSALSVLGYVVVAAPLVGLPVAVVKRQQRMIERCALGLMLLGAASAVVTMQKKFYQVHWVTLVGPMSFVLVALADEGRRVLEKRPRLDAFLATIAPLLVIALGYLVTPESKRVLSREAGLVLPYAIGSTSREAYARNFTNTWMDYSQVDIDATSDFLRAEARVGDEVCVRGFSPQIYAQTGMRYGGRFFWTNFIYHPLSYRRADYIAEDRDALTRTRPRFIVTPKANEGRGDIESAETYYPLGYHMVRELGSLQVSERTD